MSKNQDIYKELKKDATSEFTEQKSKFLGFAFLVKSEDEAKNYIDDLRKAHPNANHVCFAYRIGNQYEHYRFSDDGEPSGTAGRPIFGQIEAFDLTNILVASVRYFGGIKLGTGGLVSNYQKSAKLTLENATILEKKILTPLEFTFNYDDTNDIQQLLHSVNAQISDTDYRENCYHKIWLENDVVKDFLKKLSQIRSAQRIER